MSRKENIHVTPEEPFVWLLEMKTPFGWLPDGRARRALVKHDADIALAEAQKSNPGEDFRVRTYRREP